MRLFTRSVEPLTIFPPYLVGARPVPPNQLTREEAIADHERFVSDIPKLARMFSEAVGDLPSDAPKAAIFAHGGRWLAERLRIKPKSQWRRGPYDEGNDLTAPSLNATIYFAAFFASLLKDDIEGLEFALYVADPVNVNYHRTVLQQPGNTVPLEPLRVAQVVASQIADGNPPVMEDLYRHTWEDLVPGDAYAKAAQAIHGYYDEKPRRRRKLLPDP